MKSKYSKQVAELFMNIVYYRLTSGSKPQLFVFRGGFFVYRSLFLNSKSIFL
jgi:hypothetical protein